MNKVWVFVVVGRDDVKDVHVFSSKHRAREAAIRFIENNIDNIDTSMHNDLLELINEGEYVVAIDCWNEQQDIGSVEISFIKLFEKEIDKD